MAIQTITRAYKFRICPPSKSVQTRLDSTLYHCQQLYNAALSERRDAYKLNRISLNYQSQQNQLPEIKQLNSDYKEIHSQVLQDILKRVDRAFQNFFRRVKEKKVKAGFPRFKSINRYDSFTYPQSGFSLTGNKLTLSKIGTVKIRLSQTVIGKVKTCTIKKEIDKWFVVFTVETAIEALPKTGLTVGIDAGIESFITLSDGTQIENPRFFQSAQKKLRVLQRSVSRKKKGGKNRKKAVLKLRKQHLKIKNQRKDFHHKVARYLVNEYDQIVIEKLNVKGMIRNHHLAKAIADVGWSSFFQTLKCKAENADKRVIEVNPNGTSQTCVCGNRVEKKLSMRWHECNVCGLSVHRDHNSAMVILSRAGQSPV